MRRPACALAVLAACGPEITVLDVDAPPAPPPPDDRGPFDAGSGGDAPLTLCEAAHAHSDFPWIERVLSTHCATAGCHTGPTAAVSLRLDAGYAYDHLVDRPSSTRSGWTRVVPGTVATSYLAVALGRAAGPPPESGVMPLGAPPLCAPLLESIERWIAAGAQP
jgi:hypothetical protein